MTGIKSHASRFEEVNGGFVVFMEEIPKEVKSLVKVKSVQSNEKDVTAVVTVTIVGLVGFFLATKDETSEILKTFITGIENLIDLKVIVIRCDNGTEFKNKVMNQFCEMKGRKPALSFMRSFGCPDTILNTIDHLGKFDGKADAGFFVDLYNNKAFQGNQSNGIAMYNIMLKMQVPNIEELRVNQDQDANINSTNNINIVSPTVNAVDIENNAIDENIVYECDDDPNMPNLEEIVYSDDDEGVDAKADMTNLDTHILVSPTPTTRIHKDHPLEQIIGDIHSAPQTRRMTKNVTEHVEPKKVIQALQDPSWIEAMQEELLQFKLQQVWTLMDLPHGKRAIGTKWVYKNKKDERGIVIRKRLDFVVYQMDVKSAFLYGKIEEEFYVCQPPRFEDLEFPNKVYKRGQIDKTLFIKRVKGDILLVQVYVDDIIFGSTKKELCTEFEKLMHKKFQMNSMGELTFFLGLQVTQKDDGIFISQDKYVDEILKKFGFSTVKRASTPMDTSKPLLKDEEAKDVDVHLYRSMIRSLMYLTASRPDIIDYAGASLDRKSTTGGCQFHRRRLISWQCKKQTIVANSTTKAEYVAASSCCGQVLWIQNQMLDYGYNFMNTKIFIDNESTICIVKNPVFHSKTKHIKIRHHFIRDSYEKRLIQVIKIHTDHNVADLLIKAFDNQKPRKAKRPTEISQFSGPIPLVADETVIKEWEDRIERAATTA
ncbi:putative ribonuclease H-like domain-containing protein [Tanacetum coccineum]